MLEEKIVASRRSWRGGAELALLAAFALTLLVLQFEEQLFTRTTVIDTTRTLPESRYFYTDQLLRGNSTIAVDAGRALSGSCTLRAGYSHPFCGLGVTIERVPGKGLNFSRVESIRLDISYRGTGDLLRLSLKNYDPRYSRRLRADTDKPNKFDVSIRSGRQTVTARLSDFSVADWWLLQNKIPTVLSGTQFENIVAFEIQTGPDAYSGVQKVTVHSISYRERILSRSALFNVLVLLWLFTIGGVILQAHRRNERVQREAADRGQQILDAIPQMVWSATDGGYEYYNRQWSLFTGNRIGKADSVQRSELVHPEDRLRAAETWKHSLATGKPYEATYRLLHRSGEYRWVLSRGSAEKGVDGRITWFGTCTDIHERVLASQALDESERLTRGIVNALPDRVSLLDLSGKVLFANPAAEVACGVPDLLNKSWADILPSTAREEARTLLRDAQAGQLGRLTYSSDDGDWWDTIIAPVTGGDDTVARLLVVSRDVTEQRSAQDKVTWSANHDPLTKLPNRRVVQNELSRLEGGGSFALALLDVDDFKRINDVAGHDAGDALLCAFAERLQAAVRTGDTVARLSGDEFALLLPGVGAETELKIVLDRVFAELRRPCVYAGRVFDCSASLGAGIFGRHGASTTELLKNVDLALYSAKAAGKRNFKIFRGAMRAQMQKRDAMLSRARTALAEHAIVPFYQPKVDLRSGGIIGFEALLRWRRTRSGIQMPARIAAAFQDRALAAELGEQMIDGVVSDMIQWKNRGIDVGHVAINASAAEFQRGDYAEHLLQKLHQAGLSTKNLQVEITETVFLGRGAEYVEKTLRLLSTEGVKIALDDFGTGYASLSHLKQFPVDILKIDRSFVQEVGDPDTPAPIIDAVIKLGRSLGIDIVAEGVETLDHHKYLVSAECHQAQGFLYSPAVAARHVPWLLQTSATGDKLAA